jgi:hypothetical protein
MQEHVVDFIPRGNFIVDIGSQAFSSLGNIIFGSVKVFDVFGYVLFGT